MRSQFLLISILAATTALAACKKSEEAKPAEPAAAPTAVAPAPTEAPAKPHGGHEARHGGVVMMTADMHLEAVLGADGKHRVYFSDPARDTLPASTMEKVSMTIVRPGEPAEEVALAKDARDEAWEGQGKPLAEPAKADVTVSYNKPGQPAAAQKIVFPAEAAGEHAEAEHEHGEHGEPAAHGEHEHGAPPATLKDAVTQLDAAYTELAAIVKDGDLAKAHLVADRLGELGEALPELAGKAGLGADDVKAMTVAGKKLRLFFHDMDEAGDSGKRDEAQKAFARYKEPMDTIKAKAALAK